MNNHVILEKSDDKNFCKRPFISFSYMKLGYLRHKFLRKWGHYSQKKEEKYCFWGNKYSKSKIQAIFRQTMHVCVYLSINNIYYIYIYRVFGVFNNWVLQCIMTKKKTNIHLHIVHLYSKAALYISKHGKGGIMVRNQFCKANTTALWSPSLFIYYITLNTR